MADETEVKKEGGEASTTTEVVEKKEVEATTTQDGINLAETLEKTLEKLTQAETERDNYKRGMLKAKGKTTDEEDDADEDLETRIANKIKADLLAGDELKTRKEAAELTQQLIKRNKELEIAMQNKAQIGSGGTGPSTETPFKVGDNILSETQIAALKARPGWDDAKIERFKQNLLKVR